MILLRKILFYIFAGLYLVLCPFAILYSLGYLYSPRGPERILKTGLIAVTTAPPGASVYLGDRQAEEKTPTVLKDLRPGFYSLTLVLAGHRPWQGTVKVEAERAALLEKVLLLPETLRFETLSNVPVADLRTIDSCHFSVRISSPVPAAAKIYACREGRFRNEEENAVEKGLRALVPDGKKAKPALAACAVADGTFWVHEGSNGLFVEGNRARLVDLTRPEGPLVTELFSVKPGTGIHYCEETGKAYFLDPESEYLRSVEIVPRAQVPFFPISEKKASGKRGIA